MSIFNTASSIPGSALIYTTAGALTLVWSGIWYVYVLNEPTPGETTLYWCYGFLLTGLTLVVIGLAIGWVARIRRPGRDAEMPRVEVRSAAVQAEQIPAVPARIPSAAIPAAPGAIGSNNRTPSTVTPAYPWRRDEGPG
jgi:hypothetical protein